VGEPDGKQLVVHDGTRLMRWNFDQSTWTGIACGAARRDLTRAQWTSTSPTAARTEPRVPTTRPDRSRKTRRPFEGDPDVAVGSDRQMREEI
jgi:hypothetical protein